MFNTFKKCCGIVAMFALYLYSAPAALAQCDAYEYTLDITFDQWAGESSWAVFAEADPTTPVASGDSYSGLASTSESICLSDGCFTFVIYDSYGDGMCCTYGDGSYTLTDPDGNVVASGGAFGDSEATDFCTPEPPCVLPDFTLDFTFDQWAGETSWAVFAEGDATTPVASGDSYSGLASTSETFTLAPGCYDLVVYDSYGDGICCTYGDGSYTLTNGCGEVLASGGAFGDSETTNFCLAAPAFCDDEAACNFGEDGACDYSCLGCTDSAACNYNAEATIDDASCEYTSCAGCLDDTAENYVEGATIASTCTYCTVEATFCYGNTPWGTVNTQIIFSYDNGGSAGLTVTFSQGTVESASWDQMVVYSSLDMTPESIIWENPTGTFQLDGLTLYSPTGVMVATIDSDSSVSCQSSSTYNPMVWTRSWDCAEVGCTDAIACNYDSMHTQEDGSCDYSCIGCMQQNAANYDPTATQEVEGSCIFCETGTYPLTVTMTDAGGDGWNGAAYSLQAIDGSADISGSADEAQTVVGDTYTDYVCTTLGCYIFSHGGGTADGENSVTLSDQFGTVYVTDLGANEVYNVDFGLFGECGFEGCTDQGCFNYNPSATIDDGSCLCPPDNDAIANAEPVACGMTLSGDLSNASDPDGLDGLYDGYSAGVWYSFNASGNDQVDVNTCGTATSGLANAISDTKMHIFKQETDGSLQLISYNDDGCGLYSSASFLTEPGDNYLIHISHWGVGVQFELALECSDCPENPSNDYCEDAIPQLDGVTFSGTVCCTNPSSLYAPFSDHQGVWFTMNSEDPALGITFDSFYFNLTNISGESMSLSIYDGNGNCEEIFIVAACSDFTGTCAGSVAGFFTLTPDTDYYFYVATPDPAGCGDFEFTTTGVHLGCMDPLADNYVDYANEDDGSCSYSIVPDNDECENAAPLACGDFIEASMGGATPDSLAPSCFPIPDGLEACTEAPSGLWPSSTSNPSCDGSTTTITTCGYAGEYSNVNVEAGTTYLFTCDPGNIATAATGDGDVIAFGLGSCVFESPVSGIIRFYESQPGNCGTTIFACTNRSVTCGPDVVVPNAGGVWYTFEGTGELHNINTCGSIIDTRMALYTAPSATACADLACATDAAGNLITSTGSFETCGFFEQDDAAIEFISEVGVTYFVYVTYDYDGVYDGQGSYNISMSCEPVVEGCTISAACNYNPDVNVETNDVCEYTSCTCANAGNPDGVVLRIEMFDFNGAGGDGWATSDPGAIGGGYVVTDTDGNVVASGSIDDALYQLDEDNFTGAEFGVDAICVDPGCYTYSFTTATFWGEEQYWAIYEAEGTEAILSVDLGAYAGLPSETTTDYDFGIGGAVCGCTDTGACNYDETATVDNGSCEYLTCAGCTDSESCSYDPEALILDLAACCYDNCVTVTLTSGASAVVTISDLDGNAIESISVSSDDASYTSCVASGCYIVSSEGSGNWTMSGIFGLAITGGADFEPTYFSVGGSNCVFGCNVLAACNYDETANILDISTCSFDDCAGCTYEIASNYYPLDDDGNPITDGFVAPSVDDGSCEFDLSNPCPADINEDGSVTTADLLVFLGAFGTICE